MTASFSQPPTPDWSLGSYEHTAAQLLPAARVVVDRAALVEGERVVDVGCGTGNATLLAAARGARMLGFDPARRLLDVAREQAAAQRLDATFAPGEAAAREIARVTAPRGRFVLSAWVPEGAIHDAVRVTREAIRRAVGAPEGAPPFAWHDRDALAELLAPFGFGVAVEESRLAFTAKSAREYVDAEVANHPLAVAGGAVLERHGEAEAVRDHVLSIYEAANEDRDAFRVTSRYVVATARRE